MQEESRRTESIVTWLVELDSLYHVSPRNSHARGKISRLAEGSSTVWLLAFRSRAADLGIAEDNLACEAWLWLTRNVEAAFTQKFTDYQYNTYPSFEMIASLLQQKLEPNIRRMMCSISLLWELARQTLRGRQPC